MYAMRFDRKDVLLAIVRRLVRDGHPLARLGSTLCRFGPVDLDLLNECCAEVLEAEAKSSRPDPARVAA